MPESELETRWHAGGCHCGAVRFRMRPRSRVALDCNCSICTKKGFLHRIVAPEDFVLEQGDDALTTYRFNTGVAQHRFCSRCGVHPFYVPRSHPDRIDVNVRCLDDDRASEFSIEPFDGRHWEENVSSIQDGPT